MVQKFRESLQISVQLHFYDVHLKFLWCHVALPIFQQVHYIGNLVTSNFVNKIFMISSLIMKFTKILCHENLELYSILHLWHKLSDGVYCCTVWLRKLNKVARSWGSQGQAVRPSFLYVQFSSKYDRFYVIYVFCNLIWALIRAQLCPIWQKSCFAPSDPLSCTWGRIWAWDNTHEFIKRIRTSGLSKSV